MVAIYCIFWKLTNINLEITIGDLFSHTGNTIRRKYTCFLSYGLLPSISSNFTTSYSLLVKWSLGQKNSFFCNLLAVSRQQNYAGSIDKKECLGKKEKLFHSCLPSSTRIQFCRFNLRICDMQSPLKETSIHYIELSCLFFKIIFQSALSCFRNAHWGLENWGRCYRTCLA